LWLIGLPAWRRFKWDGVAHVPGLVGALFHAGETKTKASNRQSISS
jgi:hypothetical protein